MIKAQNFDMNLKKKTLINEPSAPSLYLPRKESFGSCFPRAVVGPASNSLQRKLGETLAD